MEPLVLHHLAIIPQQLHAELEILPALHIGHHHVVVRAIQQELPQKLNTLSLGHVRVRLNKDVVESPKEQLEIGCQVGSHKVLMAGKNLL